MDTKDTVGKCDLDGRAVTCWKGKILGVRNCALASEVCKLSGGKAECGFPTACPAGLKSEWTCAGSRMVKCDGTKYLSIDCSVLNLTCVTEKGVAGCAPPTTACKSDKISCSGTNAVGCVSGKEVKVACGDQGMTCADPSKDPTDRTVGVCEMPVPDKACDVKTFKSSCKGSTIEYCSHGGVRTFQCKTIGASKCVMDKGTGPRCTA
jgi:hypothetical protein